ncbi:hypothetical protein T06_325 [Trichinella sp. T6]|nr:hypothetical protein T06_325 [Trichinella sp. T6]
MNINDEKMTNLALTISKLLPENCSLKISFI